jgi:xanthine/uracil permease
MISWTRLGYLGFMIPLVVVLITSFFSRPMTDNALRIAMLIAAIVVWVVGKKLNSEEKQDGEEEVPHRTFGMPMQWCALLWVGLAIALSI